MKKAIIILAILLVPVMSFAEDPGGKISKRKVSAVVSQYRGKQGVEVLDIGYLGTALMKGIASISSGNDKDAREALTALKGLKGMTIFSFEDADAELKQKINGKLNKMLKGVDLLMEAKDDGETMRIYGSYSEKTGKVSDVALFSPDGTFIFLVGSFNLNDISSAMAK